MNVHHCVDLLFQNAEQGDQHDERPRDKYVVAATDVCVALKTETEFQLLISQAEMREGLCGSFSQKALW